MQSRRYDDYETGGLVGRDRRGDIGPDRYESRRNRTPPRFVDPHNPRRVVGGDGRSRSVERRELGWDFGGGGGGRRDRLRSRSPRYGEVVRRGAHYEGIVVSKDMRPTELRGKYDFVDYVDVQREVDTVMRNEYGRKNGGSRVAREDDSVVGNEYGHKHGSYRVVREDDSMVRNEYGHKLGGSRVVREDEVSDCRQGMVGYGAGALDGSSRGVNRFPVDVAPTSRYVDRGGIASSINMSVGQVKDARVGYADLSSTDKSYNIEPHGGDRTVFHMRSDPYSILVGSNSKELMGTSNYKESGIMFPGTSKVNYSGPLRGNMNLPVEDYPRSSAKIIDPFPHGEYEPTCISGTERVHASDIKRRILQYEQGTLSPTRTLRQDQFLHKPRVRESDEYVNLTDGLYREIDLHNRVDYGLREFSRPSTKDLLTERMDNYDNSRGIENSSRFLDLHYQEKKTGPDYVGLSRDPAAFGNAHFHSEPRISREKEISYLGTSQDHEMSHRRMDDDFIRDVHPGSRKERLRSSPEFPRETELHRVSNKPENMEGVNLGLFDRSKRILKRKYTVDDETSRHTRNLSPSEWDTYDGRNDHSVRDEEWILEDVRGPTFSRRGGYTHVQSRRSDPISRDEFLSHDPEELPEDSPTGKHKYARKYLKGHARPGSHKWHNSNHSDKRHILSNKQKHVWVKGQNNNQVDELFDDIEQFENWSESAKREPPEDSEEFKELVQRFFFIFSKKLNDNPGVRKRYEEQGKGGSLFCIVCGRSLSKEFLDTQRLAAHAFMSGKAGLRAQHLGLHKAICVLLGWNTAVSPDTVLWRPDPLSSVDAWCQREDLIVWPPVVVTHYIPHLNNDSEWEGLDNVDAVRDFIRGKGIGSGKVTLGRPARSGTMVVKFLGTITGLHEAEKLHDYFLKKKQGRKEFAQIASGKGKGKGSYSKEGESKGGEGNELLLYGYMAIAQDLDKVDFDTNRKCSIKSKKDIQDLLDAPVKPE